jgi:hypothetical protein
VDGSSIPVIISPDRHSRFLVWSFLIFLFFQIVVLPNTPSTFHSNNPTMFKQVAALLSLLGLVQFGSPNEIAPKNHLPIWDPSSSTPPPGQPFLDPSIFAQALEEVAAGNINNALDARNLQQVPSEVCDQYNAAAGGLLQCECERFGRRDTRVFCDYVNKTCNEDESICFDSTVEVIVDLDAISTRVVQCTFFEYDATVEEPTDTCITVYPLVDGNFTQLFECSVTLNGEDCNFCVVDNGFNTSELTFDCCNVMDDVKATNNLVGPNGGAFAFFDPVEVEGQCSGQKSAPGGSGGGGSSGAIRQSLSLVVALVVAGASVWL